MDVDELNKQFGIKAQNLSDNEAYNQYQNDNIATLRGRVEENVYKNESDKTLKQVQGDWVNEYAKEHPEVLNDDELLFQPMDSAGAGVNDIEDAKREWEEKGTDSKYFKKWFGDSKVVDSEGKPLVVYHGTLEQNIDEFDLSYARNEDAFFFTDNKNIAIDYAKEYEETTDNISGKVYPVYLSMKNPYVVDAQGKTYSQYYSQLQNDFSGLAEQGYDGLIIKNIKDNKWNNTQPELSNVYAVLNPEQIKSIDNRGTFDSNSGNIYYQPIDNNTNDTLYRADGKPIGIEYYDNSDIKDVKPFNIRNFKFKDIKNNKEITHRKIKDKIFENKKDKNFKNNKSGIVASLSNNHIDEMINSIFKDRNNNLYRLKKEIIANVETIFEKAIPILNHAELEEKNKDLYDVQKVHRFALPIKIGNKNFFTLITVKQRNDYEKANIDEFAIYDLSSKTNEMLDRNWQDETSKPHSQASTISITDLVDFVNTHLNKYRKSLHQNNNIQYQSMTKEQLLNVYMNQEFGMSADDITDMVTEDIKNILTDYDVSEDEFKFEDIRIYGSYSKGTNKVGSDLDIVVQYSGSMREDSAFNMLHDEELSIYDKKGNKYS